MEPEALPHNGINNDTFWSNISNVYFNGSQGNASNGTEYEYVAFSDAPLEELVPVSVVYGLTLVLGVVGNVLVIFSVTRYQQMMTTTNTFLLSLATADLLLVLICVPVKVRPITYRMYEMH